MPRGRVQRLRKVCLAAGLSFPLSADFAHRLAPLPWCSSSTVSAEVQDRLGYAACRDSESLKARPRREPGRFRFVLECAGHWLRRSHKSNPFFTNPPTHFKPIWFTITIHAASEPTPTRYEAIKPELASFGFESKSRPNTTPKKPQGMALISVT